MYTKYFGFNEKPFTLTPNPRFIYLSKNHKEAFAHLLYGINNHYGFIELIGEVGAGKTTVLRTLLSQLNEESYRSALIFNPCLTGVELLRSINHEFGLNSTSEYANELLGELNSFLLKENTQGITVVLVIDEAQNLSPEILEQLRLISNLETENDKLIQIILAGQLELSTILELPQLRQLNQRIAVRYRLKPMSSEETCTYIRHRMVVAGETGGVSFSRNAQTIIHLYSRGLPRLINNLCDRALLIAYGDERRLVTAGIVLRAVKELLNTTQVKRLALQCAALLSVAIIIAAVFLSVISGRVIFNKRAAVADPPPATAIYSSVSVLPGGSQLSGRHASPPSQSDQTLKPQAVVTVTHAKNNLVSKRSKKTSEAAHLHMSAHETRSLQQLLTQAGVYRGVIDGKFGPVTAKAVHDFQMLAGISPDKTVGEATREALARFYTNQKMPADSPAGSTE